ncbi:peptidoglycan recognition protein family protein [Parafrankia discariae]|uniref:peptidoglycan recognition protein family protein n=1 Tax=Parafrankia discariae TaxID=365528 RepID=UPI000378A878|nr:N-acetylmuramoyl-L-alanine amidase [Parafrankia discariae]
MSTLPTLYPPAEYRPVRNVNQDRAMVTPTRGLIPHLQVGNGSLFRWFDNPDSGVSTHLWLSKAGGFEQYVPLNLQAWAQAAGNPYWISVETEGYETEGYTAIQIRRLAELFAWGMQHFGWAAAVTDQPAGGGIGTHRMGGVPYGGPRTCPGDLRAAARGEILAAAQRITSPPGVVNLTAGRYADRPTLRAGSTGPHVAELQRALNLAATKPPLTADGDYGPRTTGAVKVFQLSAALSADGICGPRTWAALGARLTALGRHT